jgi:hypothetical protein
VLISDNFVRCFATLQYRKEVYLNDMNALTALVEGGSSVSIVSDYGLDGRGSIPDRGRGFFL